MSTKLSVLLIEDNPADARLIQHELDGRVRIDHAATLADARQRLETCSADVLLLDLDLPDSFGLETLMSMLSSTALPIVVSTGNADVAVATEAVRAGAQDFWVKGSTDGDVLFRLLNHAVDRARQTRLIRQLAEQAERERDRAEAANRNKSAFLAAMSHEVRTPLTGLMGMADLLEDMVLPDEARRIVDALRESASGLKVIVDDILDLSKLEAGKLDLEQRSFVLEDLLRQVMDALHANARQAGLALDVDIAPDCPDTVSGDPTRLRQILLNLVSNAIKFTERGFVRLSASCAEGDELRFQVTDTGIGMTPEALDTLFRAYAQADASVARTHGGTGLGLAICRRLVALMGGRIGATSNLGQGSTFTLVLPLPRSTAPEAGARTLHPGARRANRRLNVLVAEDNRVNQLLLTTLLDRWGHSSRVVDNGRDAVRLVAQADQPFDVVLMDLRMPVMGGLDAAREIGRQVAVPPPILGVSADAMAVSPDQAEAAGMAGLVAKPIDRDALLSAIERVVPGLAHARPADGTAPHLLAPMVASGRRAVEDAQEDAQVDAFLRTLRDFR